MPKGQPKPELDKAYDASKVEDAIYRRWEASGFFNPDTLPGGKKKKPFTIVLPPPNATGVLHVGHATMLALEDLMIRYKRMRGFASLWIPGTDHASIATQNKVEKLIQEKEKKTRHDLGRAEFLKRVEAFVKNSQDTIRNQIRKMGSSIDWSREAYTLDAPRSEAVIEMFNRMYEDGLVYRGERVVNWCVRCTSTLADDEVEYKAQKAKLYFLKYGPFSVATTRPETKLGDTAVAANPSDERYKKWIGKSFELDWGEGTKPLSIRVIGDHEVDPKFGSGLVGVTPAHSAVDFRMAEKNKLPIINVIGEDGRMLETAGKYKGMTVLEARHAFVKDLEAQDLIEKVEEIDNNLSACYRCSTAIEPLTSLQWFVDVNKKIKGRGKSLKELSLEAVRGPAPYGAGRGGVKIIPERFEKVYYHWMENLRDWCVSRQIWFGHRIPAWYCENRHVTVARKAPKACATCKSKTLKQDEDTFDTWFSSGTWTFTTLGWPKKTPDLKRFHPTDVLETGYDILFFWVARMILMTEYAMKQVPFKTVYLHGLVRDEQGRKMSKSLGNVLDPLDVIPKYGTDAVRLSLVLGTAPGADAKVWDEKIAGFRNFTNKLWNISRFVLTSVSKVQRVSQKPTPKTLADRWILARLETVAAEATASIEKYEFSPAGELLREFAWTEFADWYLEIAKIQMQDAKLKASTEKILLYALENILKLWHPYMPFVTEAIWDLLAGNATGKKFLMIESWPKAKKTATPKEFALIQDLIGAIRNIRSEYKVEPAKKIDATLIAGAKAKLLKDNAAVIATLARIEPLTILAKGEKPKDAASAMVGGIEIHLPLAGLVDPAKEKARLEKEKQNLEGVVKNLEAKLANPGYTDKAPKDVVEKTRAMLAEKKEELKKIEAALGLS